MSEHELLLRHAARWASEKKRPFDAGLVDTALTLRAAHGDGPANLWPAGSAQHLMLERWPLHGPGVPDVAQLVASLDSFWRFLRGTGRMAGASADPKVLAAEAKAAGRKMAAACANPPQARAVASENWDDAWNANPWDDGGWADDGWRDEGTDDMYFPPPAAEAAPFARESRFVRQVLALADWADGQQLTSIKVLRPEPAREAYDALDLWEWDRDIQQTVGLLDRSLDADAEAERRQDAREWWRSAGNCLSLDRLWTPAVNVGLVDVTGTRARRLRDQDPVTDDEWVTLAHMLGLALVGRTLHPDQTGSLLFILYNLAEEWGGQPLTVAQLQDMYWDEALAGRVDATNETILRGVWGAEISHRVAQFDDCRWWRRQFGRLALTPLGWSFALYLVTALDEGWIWADD